MTFIRRSGCDTGRKTVKLFWGSQQGQTGIYLYRSAQTGSEVQADSYSNGASSPFSIGKVNTYTYTSDYSPPSNSEFQNEWRYNPVLFYIYITCIAKSLTFLLCLSYLNLYPSIYLRKGFTALYTILLSFYRPEFLQLGPIEFSGKLSFNIALTMCIFVFPYVC